jgi:hypothetical protein
MPEFQKPEFKKPGETNSALERRELRLPAEALNWIR